MCRRSQVSSLSSCSGATASWSTAAHITSRIHAATPAVRLSVSASGILRAGVRQKEKPSSAGCAATRFCRACSAIAGALSRRLATRRCTSDVVSSRYAWTSAGGACTGSGAGTPQRATRSSPTRVLAREQLRHALDDCPVMRRREIGARDTAVPEDEVVHASLATISTTPSNVVDMRYGNSAAGSCASHAGGPGLGGIDCVANMQRELLGLGLVKADLAVLRLGRAPSRARARWRSAREPLRVVRRWRSPPRRRSR